MRALELKEGGVELTRAWEPAEVPEEALLRVDLAGVCATDLELVKGYMDFCGVLGHEWVGTVLEAPGGVSVGQRVVGEINCPCRKCDVCLAGRGNHCPDRTVLGILGRDGVFAEVTRLPVANLIPVPDTVPDEAAVFVEPLAAACRILEQVHVQPGQRCVVLGAGRLGQLCARVLALPGAEVTVVSRNPGRLDLLPEGIAGRTLEPPLPDSSADLVVDCTGAPAGLAEATRIVRPQGTLVLKTTVHDPAGATTIPWVIDEVTVVGSRCGPFAPALRLLERGLVDPTPLISHRMSLDDGVEALDRAAAPESVKVLLKP